MDRKKASNSRNLILFSLVSVILQTGCSSNKPFDGGTLSNPAGGPAAEISYAGYFVVTSLTTDPGTGPGLVTMFKPDGTFHANLRDLFPSIEWASGTVFAPPDKVLVSIGNGTRIESLNLTTLVNANFATARINGAPNRALTRDPVDGTLYLAEQNTTTSTIEKYDSTGSPIGAPFIPTTTGACTLNNPTSLAYISTTQNVVAVMSNRINIYNKDGGCVSTVTIAPFSANTPYAAVYHPQSDRLLVAFSGNSTIMSCTTAGAGCVSIYVNTSIVNTPRTIAVDASGFVYIGSSGTDTIEKFSWAGVGNNLVRVGSASFIGPGIYTQNPTSVMVVQ